MSATQQNQPVSTEAAKPEQAPEPKKPRASLKDRAARLGLHERTPTGKKRGPAKQLQRSMVLEALVRGISIRAAARFADVSDWAVRQWMEEPDFAAAVQAGQDRQRREAERILVGGAPSVARTLVAAGRGRRALSGAQVSAAREVLARSRVGAADRIELGGTVGVQARVAQLSDAELLAVAEGVATLPEDGEAGGDAGG